MNAHKPNLDGAPALILKSVDLMGRIARLAPHLRPTLRLRVMGELSLCERVVEELETLLALDAQFTVLEAMKPKRTLPPKCPEFIGGRGLRALPRRAWNTQKRITAGSRA